MSEAQIPWVLFAVNVVVMGIGYILTGGDPSYAVGHFVGFGIGAIGTVLWSIKVFTRTTKES